MWGKAEFLQPGGSVKDRAAKAILERARALGELPPGGPVTAMSSGNLAAGLAVVCNVLRHPLVVFVSAGNSPERTVQLRALGADVRLVAQVTGAPGEVTGEDIGAADEAAQAFAAEHGAYYVDQFSNPGSVEAHEEGTGPEIAAQLGGEVAAFAAVLGSGGTFVGVARAFGRAGLGTRCVAVEPAGAEVLAGREVTKPRHVLQGSGDGFVPPHWSGEADGFLAVTDEEARAWRLRLAREDGLHIGYSSGANAAAAASLAASGDFDGGNVVTILCDTGLKYGAP